MSDKAKALQDAIVDLLAEDTSLCIEILTGSLVSLIQELIRRRGEDPEKKITLNGGPREVVILPRNDKENSNG